MDQIYCVLDYETRSEVDLKKSGIDIYARHPSTKILCVAWAVGTKEQLPNAKIRTDTKDLVFLLTSGVNKIVAHNAAFERKISHYIGGYSCSAPERWICTASMAAALALPRSLEGACQALNLSVQKDMDGRRLMLKMSKPRKATKHNNKKWHEEPEDLERLIQYCKKDVEAEIELFLALPELSPKEREVWIFDQYINDRGINIDRKLVTTALDLIDKEVVNLNEEVKILTNNEVTSVRQRDKTLKWMEEQKFILTSLQAKVVKDALGNSLLPKKVRRVLEIRKALSKSSTAKYKAFSLRSGIDGRCRDNLLYHGASTGRWSGQGVQLQNLPKPTINITEEIIKDIKSGDIEWLRAIHGSPMEVFSSALRNAIIATPGKEIFCADYAAIETRVLFWVAEHKAGLEAFHQGRDLYVEMAQKIFGNVDIDKEKRFLGKTAVLGCGYGVGKVKFQKTCALSGVDISIELAETAVRAYRDTHFKIPQLWRNLEDAIFQVIEAPGLKLQINKTFWWVENNYLWCELPSGRKLAYREPEIRYEETEWGNRAKVYCSNVNSKTKKWEKSGLWAGVFTENVVQAVSRDLMVDAMFRLEKAGYEVILSVHDEIVCERDIFQGDLGEFEDLMATTSDWGKDIPIKVEGWNGDRYHK